MDFKLRKKGAKTTSAILCHECKGNVDDHYFEYTGPLIERRRVCAACVFRGFLSNKIKPIPQKSWIKRTLNKIHDFFGSFGPAINRVFG